MHAKKILFQCKSAWKQSKKGKNFVKLEKDHLLKIQSISIDYSILEKENNIGMFTLNSGWNDIGSWDSFLSIEKSNISNFKNDQISINSKNNFVLHDKKNISLVGVDNLIIVSHENNLLILKQGDSESCKKYFKIH